MKKIGAARRIGVVTEKEYLTPHLIRVKLKVDDIHDFQHATPGNNNKILVPPPGVKEIHFPEMDPETGKMLPIPDHLASSRRTYTHSGIDLERSELFIDFVAHGEEGPASAWAIHCQPGDILGIMMKTGPKELFPEVENMLFVGDATALPAIAAMVKQLPEHTSATCVLEVYGKEDELELPSRASTTIHWLHNPHPERGSELAQRVRGLALPGASRFVFIAAEFDTVKDLRGYFRKELEWDRTEISAYSYWRAGVAEDRSEKDRRAEKASM